MKTRRVLWAICGAITLAVAVTATFLDLVTTLPRTPYDQITNHVAPEVGVALLHAFAVFFVWAGIALSTSAFVVVAGTMVEDLRFERRVRRERSPLRVTVQVYVPGLGKEAALDNIGGGLPATTQHAQAAEEQGPLLHPVSNSGDDALRPDESTRPLPERSAYGRGVTSLLVRPTRGSSSGSGVSSSIRRRPQPFRRLTTRW